MNKRQELAMQTRENLICEAKKIFAIKDFQDVSVEEITKACGVAKGTFYTYFKKKEDIISEIGFLHFEQLQERILNENKPILEKLNDYFISFMELVEEYGIHICRQWIINNLNPSSDTVNLINNETKINFDINCIRLIFNQAVEKKELSLQTPIDLLSYLFMSELYGMMIIWCMSNKEFEPLEWISQFNQLQLSKILDEYLL
ncbi:MAG: TetR/AcrR family transcriptional regulator [Thomasclavelia sp.]